MFSFASGIFHPYYVSLLAPFSALLVGAGVALMLPEPWGRADSPRSARIVAPLVIGAGVITELVVLGTINGSLSWAVPLVIVLAGGAAIALAFGIHGRVRLAVAAVALAALTAAPAAWAAETIGHATNGTFPTGGPASAGMGGPGGSRGGFRGGFGPPGGFGASSGSRAPSASGILGITGGGQANPGSQSTPGGVGQPGFVPGAGAPGGVGPGGGAGPGGFGGGPGAGGMFGGDSTSLRAAIRYAQSHGGGTVGVMSQSSAAAAIVQSDANIAGLGGFSGRESTISVSWLASEVAAGHLRWIVGDQTGGGRLPGDTRTGSQSAFSAAAKACKAITVSSTRCWSVNNVRLRWSRSCHPQGRRGERLGGL